MTKFSPINLTLTFYNLLHNNINFLSQLSPENQIRPLQPLLIIHLGQKLLQIVQMLLGRLRQVEQGGLDLLHSGQSTVTVVLDVTDADGQGVAVVVAQPAVILGFGKFGRFLENKLQNVQSEKDYKVK